MTAPVGGFVFLFAAALSAAEPKSCAPCHTRETEAFAASPMTLALKPATAAARHLTVTLGPYTYAIDGAAYTVADSSGSLRIPLEWAFGNANAGQTYVYQREGKWYESRVSYFAATRKLDLTLGADPAPHNLIEAAGRLAPATEMRQCFDCHATGIPKSVPVSLDNMTVGVQCERCHGPSEAHLATNAPMRKLSALTTEQLSDFCGQCHRTWSQVAASGPHGIQNVRFQPYRLASSRCYDAADARIKCTACHDPHRAVVTSAAFYDAKCTACHSAAGRAHRCRVASANCATCHMPKLDLPGAHQKFTDHRIRIARANEAYPD